MPTKKNTQRKSPPPAPKKKKTPQKEPHQVFYEAYQALCKKHGYQINVIPAYKARDDGTFSTVLQVSVSELDEKLLT